STISLDSARGARTAMLRFSSLHATFGSSLLGQILSRADSRPVSRSSLRGPRLSQNASIPFSKRRPNGSPFVATVNSLAADSEAVFGFGATAAALGGDDFAASLLSARSVREHESAMSNTTTVRFFIGNPIAGRFAPSTASSHARRLLRLRYSTGRSSKYVRRRECRLHLER